MSRNVCIEPVAIEPVVPPSLSDKLLVTASEAAFILSMGRSTFWRKVQEHVLPQPIKIGGLTRWRVDDLKRTLHQANPPTTA